MRNLGYVIQLENEKNVKEWQKGFDDMILLSDDLIDTVEDGCVVGYGLQVAKTLEGEEFLSIKKEIIEKIVSLGGIYDKDNDTITFTNDFCERYMREYFDAFKQEIEKVSFEEFCTKEFKEKIENLYSLFPLNNFRVYSETGGLWDFDELVTNKFSLLSRDANFEMLNNKFKILTIVNGY